MGNRELVALLGLSSGCLVTVSVLWLFLTVPWVGMQCVIVVFPDHTHLLFLQSSRSWLLNSICRAALFVFLCFTVLWCRFGTMGLSVIFDYALPGHTHSFSDTIC